MTRTIFAGLTALAATLAATLAALPASAAPADTVRESVRSWRVANERQLLSDYSGFVAMPSIASTLADVDRNADVLEQQLKRRGFTTTQLRAKPGTPASVFGERKTPGARRTILFYAHYDGQPVNQPGWLDPPFQPTLRTAPPASQKVYPASAARLDPEWRLHGRTTGDDKSTIAVTLWALDALAAKGLKAGVNIKILWEGEEEAGSPHFGDIVRANKALLAADLLIMGDGPMHQSGRPLVSGGNRGIIDFEATVYGPARALHDGHYGNWVPSPTVMIADLVMQLRDENGTIKIPGLASEVPPRSAADTAALAALPPVEAQLKRDLALARTIGPDRIADGYLAPTLNVRAIHGGDTKSPAANAIATQAWASFDIRLAPGQTMAHVKDTTEAYLTAQGWHIIRTDPDTATRLAHPKLLKLTWGDGGSVAVKVPLDTPAAQAVIAAITRSTGGPPVQMPIMGGTTPFAEIVEALNAPMIGVSVANADDNQHAANENIRLGNLWDGIEIYAALLADTKW
ncbi:MAG: M20/M25/M40 family metallo-hydrolase [Sphingomonadales bacterium]|jgi:acetylornithine deacetylase/succinyl-diaminopimelate desuccinylase-like protein